MKILGFPKWFWRVKVKPTLFDDGGGLIILIGVIYIALAFLEDYYLGTPVLFAIPVIFVYSLLGYLVLDAVRKVWKEYTNA